MSANLENGPAVTGWDVRSNATRERIVEGAWKSLMMGNSLWLGGIVVDLARNESMVELKMCFGSQMVMLVVLELVGGVAVLTEW
jgi:hypothetical protein